MLKSCSTIPFLHSGFTCISSFWFACIDNKCYIVYTSQRHSAEQHVIYNEVKYFSLGEPLLVVTLHGIAPQNTNCNCSVLIIHALILRCVCVCASSCTNESLLLCKARLCCKWKTILHQGI